MDLTDSLMADKGDSESLAFKILVVGEPSVGKSSLVKRYVNGIYEERYKSTIGVAHSDKVILWNGRRVTLQFWDLAGQDRLNNMARVYYRGAHGALCVCDVLRQDTRLQVDNWRDQIHEYATRSDGTQAHPPCVLVINKMDLYGKSAERSWLSSQIRESDNDGMKSISLDGDKSTYSKEFYANIEEVAQLGGYETGVPASAKLGVGIELAISKLIEMMVRRHEQESRDRYQIEPTQAMGTGDQYEPNSNGSFRLTSGGNGTVEDPDGLLDDGTMDPGERAIASRSRESRCGC